jgi:hypothetical protein
VGLATLALFFVYRQALAADGQSSANAV